MEPGNRASARQVLTLTLAATALAVALFVAAPAEASRFQSIKGFDAPGPSKYDKVGLLEFGPKKAKNVLVMIPGTSGGAGYMKPMASDLQRRLKKRGKGSRNRWQVWVMDRRENLLEDQSAVNAFKRGDITAQEYYDYYLGYLIDPSVTNHFVGIPDDDVGFARDWGMKVAVEDIGESSRRPAASAATVARSCLAGIRSEARW